MPLGVEVGLSPGNFMLDGDPAPPTEKVTASTRPILGLCLLWPWSPISATAELLFKLPHSWKTRLLAINLVVVLVPLVLFLIYY